MPDEPAVSGQPAGHWLAKIESSAGGTDALRALPFEQRLEVLVYGLRYGDPAERKAAAGYLAAFGSPELREAAPALEETMASAGPVLRLHAARAHWRVTRRSGEAVPTLVDLLEDGDAGIRERAAETLHSMGVAARNALPALVEALKDEAATVRGRAALAIGALGSEAEKAVPSLLPLLEDGSGYVRRVAALSLGEIGWAGDPVIAALIERLDDTEMAAVAARALAKLAPDRDDVREALVDRLKSREAVLRRAAAVGLGEMGAGAEEALPHLAPLLEDPDPSVIREAHQALLKIEKAREEKKPGVEEGEDAEG